MMEKMKQEKGSTRKKGGMITMPFIFANEVCEKLAVVGFQTNMINYLTTQLHLPLTKAANTLTNFGGTASLTPLLGAFISDSYIGKFWTITVASLIYQIGMICLTVSAILPRLRPPPCRAGPSATQLCEEATSWQLTILYGSLLLTALGSGGIRPCVVAFGAEQFDETDPTQKNQTWKYFNWYYFVMGASILVAVTVIVYIQDNVGWGWGLGIPTLLMGVSVVAFVFGYSLYRNMDPVGSPFTRLVQVCVAACKKRRLHMVSDTRCLYENEEIDDAISSAGKLIHTKQLTFLDKAAIVTEEDNPKAPNLWRLSTVHRVEELKSIIRMGPIWASGIILITAYAQQNTFSLNQAKTMDRHLTRGFQIPAGSMSVFTITAMLTTIFLYDRLLVPLTRRFTGLDRGITFLHRMAVGFLISVFATLVAGFVELKRRHAATVLHQQLPVFWLVPQYALHGIAEAFMSIGHLEFFYDQAPESMRSSAMALFWTAISMGNYLSTLLVTLVHRFTDWLPDTDINAGKLERFYWLITLLQVLNLAYYLLCARFYTLKPIQVQKRKDEEGIELAIGDRV
ncbi:hypothetical protein V2J09_012809 [Rumex salicifolius]